jgi:hypothetical protein
MITIVFIGVFYFHFLDTMPKKKYAIHSYIKNDNKYYDSVYYTDTLEISGDSIGYHNSDGSYVSINNDNKFIDTLK